MQTDEAGPDALPRPGHAEETQGTGAERRRGRRPPRRRDPAQLAPSVRALLEAFAGRPPLTARDLRALTGLPRRTISDALRSLRTRGLLREQRSLRDSRQTFFWLDPAFAPEHIGVVPPPA